MKAALRLPTILPAMLLAAALLLLALPARAQDPADYLHGSAYKYVSGRMQEALVQAEEGLRKFPSDAKLKSMVTHLRRMQDQKRQDQNSGGNSQGGEGQDKKDEKGESGDQGGDKDKEQKDKKEGPEDDKGKEGEEEAPSRESEDQSGKDSTGQAEAPVKPGEMSKEEAERLLNSIQDDEKKEHRQQQRRYRKKVEVEQDW